MVGTQPRAEFHLGLTMSGAISAGAYTAGVFDFLIQALDEWERAKAAGDPALPGHFLGLKVMSGASAGAITAAIGAVALADASQAPVYFDAAPGAPRKVKCWLPKLYDTWVTRPGLCAEREGEPDFLRADDLKKPWPQGENNFLATSGLNSPDTWAPRPAVSLLDSSLLDQIAKAALDVKATGAARPYVSQTLHIYLTLTNLRGVPYQVRFAGDGDYRMLTHGDRVHYTVTGLGGWATKSAFSDNDLSRPLAAAALRDGHAGKAGWRDFTICAMASAAFPVGLAPRHIGADAGEYAGGGKDGAKPFRRFPSDVLADCRTIEPDWPKPAPKSFPFMTVDGGAIDNDPFEYARFGLKEPKPQAQGLEGAAPQEPDLSAPNPHRPEEADRAVVMISPFPAGKPPAAEGRPAADIVSIASALLPALIDQARFKPSELALAANPDYASRYLISPRRIDGKTESPYPIASGLLGGFGGFVARAFRDHDFQLGRRNCQRFLQGTFALPAANPVIASWPQAAKPRFTAIAPDDARGKAKAPSYVILPLFGSAQETVELAPWPRLSRAAFDHLQTRIAGRFDAVAPAILNDNVSGILRILLRLALIRLPIGGIRRRALAFVRAAMLSDLIRRDQIEGFDDVPPLGALKAQDVRAALAVIAGANRRPVGAHELAAALGAPAKPASEEALAAALDALCGASGKPYQLWRAPWRDDDGCALYALADLRPALPTTLWRTLRGAIRSLRVRP